MLNYERRRRVFYLFPMASLVGFLWLGCATDSIPPGTGSSGDMLVDCLVPGQIRPLDEKVVYPTQRQMVRVTEAECRARGGEQQ